MSVRNTVPLCTIQKKHQVLFIIDQLCEAGGAERALLQTIRLLPKDRFRPSLITFKIDTRFELFRDLPCPAYIFPLRRTYDWNALKTARTIRKFIRQERIDIVHTFHETSDLWAGLISRMKGGPCIVSSRRDMGIQRSPKHNVAYRLLNTNVDLVLAVSEEVRRYCIERDRLPPGKVATLYNGLDLDKINQLNGVDGVRLSRGISPDTPLILTVGHVRRVKGTDVLVETAAKVVPYFPQALFLVVGRICEPDYLQEIESRIRELGLQTNVRFLGEYSEVYSLLKSGSVFFLPSRSEGFSNALLEAMACGLPSVVTRVGGNAEAIEEGRNGYVIESEDADAAADRIVRLLRDPVQAKRMGENGRRSVEEKFTADGMIGQLIAHYELLLEARRN
jgi:glycosyltransferase involved in cell wall biosynthesis